MGFGVKKRSIEGKRRRGREERCMRFERKFSGKVDGCLPAGRNESYLHTVQSFLEKIISYAAFNSNGLVTGYVNTLTRTPGADETIHIEISTCFLDNS